MEQGRVTKGSAYTKGPPVALFGGQFKWEVGLLAIPLRPTGACTTPATPTMTQPESSQWMRQPDKPARCLPWSAFSQE